MKIILKSFEGHAGRPGKRGGSVPRNSSTITIQFLKNTADVSLPPDDDTYEYFYHAVRYPSELDNIEKSGIHNESNRVFLSKDEIRDRGSGFAIVRVNIGAAEEGTDFVEEGLTYREWTTDKVSPNNVIRVVREIPLKGTMHTIREDELAQFALANQGYTDTADLPEEYKKWFNITT